MTAALTLLLIVLTSWSPAGCSQTHDPLGIPRALEDFGQTLALLGGGLGSGPYLQLHVQQVGEASGMELAFEDF